MRIKFPCILAIVDFRSQIFESCSWVLSTKLMIIVLRSSTMPCVLASMWLDSRINSWILPSNKAMVRWASPLILAISVDAWSLIMFTSLDALWKTSVASLQFSSIVLAAVEWTWLIICKVSALAVSWAWPTTWVASSLNCSLDWSRALNLRKDVGSWLLYSLVCMGNK